MIVFNFVVQENVRLQKTAHGPGQAAEVPEAGANDCPENRVEPPAGREEVEAEVQEAQIGVSGNDKAGGAQFRFHQRLHEHGAAASVGKTFQIFSRFY